jgi:hypothetical protein
MHCTSKILVAALFVSLTTIPIASQQALAIDIASPAKKSPQKSAATAEKMKNLGDHLGRAFDIVCELFSGNEAELLSKNKTALLSGNKPAILSGNKPAILSGNTTPILSGNSFSVLSNFKIEVHIENTGNHIAPPPATATPPKR